MAISRWIPLRMRNVSEESCREDQDTHFMFNNLFLPENRAVYAIPGKMWHRQRDHALRRIRFAFLDYKFIYFIKATDTHSE